MFCTKFAVIKFFSIFISLVFTITTIFTLTACDDFNKPLSPFIARHSGVARATGHSISDFYQMSNGDVAIQAGVETTIQLTLENPHSFDLSFDLTGDNPEDKAVVESDGMNAALIRITNPDYLEEFDLTLTMMMPSTNRAMPSFKLPKLVARYLNDNLETLTVSPGELEPAFQANNTGPYAVYLPEETTSIDVTAAVAPGMYSSYTINNSATKTDETTTIEQLGIGVNTVSIIVTAEVGRTKEYVINVIVGLVVLFDVNGGDALPPQDASKELTLGGAYGTLPTPTRTGYIFDGWYTAAAGGTQVTSETVVTNPNAHTLYARWRLSIIGDIEMVWIPAGSYTRGSNDSVDWNASPAHTVTLTHGFYMGRTEVTQGQWEAVMTGNTNGISANPSYFSTGADAPTRPVEQVSWYDIIVFCNRLSMMEGLTPAYRISGSTNPDDWGAVPYWEYNAAWDTVTIVAGSNGYRLPTEAQWEYAARAGTTTPWSHNEAEHNDYMWYWDNSSDGTKPAGTKLPNAWGLHDMHGNVWEWCWDWWGSYAGGAQTDPAGAVSGDYRVIRGGCWDYDALGARSAFRNNFYPYDRVSFIGFRLVRP